MTYHKRKFCLNNKNVVTNYTKLSALIKLLIYNMMRNIFLAFRNNCLIDLYQEARDAAEDDGPDRRVEAGLITDRVVGDDVSFNKTNI
jgi:hypothetical protein